MVRIGINPEKANPKKLNHVHHRVIIPVYIPNLTDEYFTQSLQILKISLESLINTVDLNKTLITVIDNASCNQVKEYLQQLYLSGKINKLVSYQSNRGKVETTLAECRASFEEYVTIADADLLYLPGWLEKTFEIFEKFPQAGAVTPLPMPHLFASHNYSCLFKSFFLKKLRLKQVSNLNDLKNFEKGIGSQLLKKYYSKQFYIQKEDTLVLLGASHVIATYKNIFHLTSKKKIPFVFQNGLEEQFIDNIFDKFGLCRLSTTNAYVYHLGNKITENLPNVIYRTPSYDIPEYKIIKPFLINLQRVGGKLIKKLIKNASFYKKFQY